MGRAAHRVSSNMPEIPTVPPIRPFSTSRKKLPNASAPEQLVTARRARVLIDLMLGEMQRAITEPDYAQSPEWGRIFGAKQSMVMNLQKLVAALVALPEETEDDCAEPSELPLTKEEVGLLTAWLSETHPTGD